MPITFLPSRVAVHAVGLLRGAGMTSATCAAAATRAAAFTVTTTLQPLASPSGVSAAAGSFYPEYADRSAGHTGSFILFRAQPEAVATQAPLPRVPESLAAELEAAAPGAALAWTGNYIDALPASAPHATAEAHDAKLVEANATPGVWHIVLFTLGGTAADGVSLPLLAQRCRDEIPGCLLMQFGPIVDVVASSGAYGATAAPEFTHALVSKMASAEALRVYGTHPIHLDLVSEMRRLSKAPPVAFDY